MTGIEKGEPWEVPVADGVEPVATVTGSDGMLAHEVDQWRGTAPLLRWEPSADSELARALGLVAGAPIRGLALRCDLLRASGAPAPAVNAIVLGGFPPGRFTRATTTTVEIDGRSVFHGEATTVIVASGQFVGGADVFANGHPGDGRAEVMVLALPAGARSGFRSRLGSGSHLPHPDITVGAGAQIDITMERAAKLVGDGGAWTVPDVRAVQIRVEAGAFSLLV